MALPVSLQAVVDQMDVINDEVAAYINRKNGELVSLTAEDISLAEGDDDSYFIPEWQRDLVDKAKQTLSDDDYLELPDRFEIGEYGIMERYCYSIEEERVRQALLRAINGKGAFRRFKEKVREEGTENEWHQFRTNALKQIAADFLQSHDIAFVDE